MIPRAKSFIKCVFYIIIMVIIVGFIINTLFVIIEWSHYCYLL